MFIASIILFYILFSKTTDLLFSNDIKFMAFVYLLLFVIFMYLTYTRNSLNKITVAIFIIHNFFFSFFMKNHVHYLLGFTVILFVLIFLELKNYKNLLIGLIIVFNASIQSIPIYWKGHLLCCETIDLVIFTIILLLTALILNSISYLFEEMSNNEYQIKRLDDYIAKLHQINITLQDKSMIREQNAIEKERKRLSVEIHDIAGYVLTSIIMLTESAKDFIERNPQRCSEILNKSTDVSRNGLEDIRLHLKQNYEYKKTQTFITKIKNVIETFVFATDIDIKIDYSSIPDIVDKSVQHILTSIIQEGLVNAFRHSFCTEIRISFWTNEEYHILTIIDNGIGFHKNNRCGIGLKGMKERLKKIDGKLQIQSSGNGVRLDILFTRN